MKTTIARDAFLSLTGAGLFPDKNKGRIIYDDVDWNEVMRLAREQSVVGLVTVGLGKLLDGILPLTVKLKFLGMCQFIERRNGNMNQFIAEMVRWLREEGCYVVLVKGQGVAQCYEKPLWRSAGDIDLLLDEENYDRAKALLSPLSEEDVVEDAFKKHASVRICDFTIELHGRMPFLLSKRVDRVIDEVIADSLVVINDERLAVRVWKNGDTDVYLPNADNDVILVFTHYLHHFFIEGVGLRQVCDWCRLLWTYKDKLDMVLLGRRLRGMGLMSEWKVFASLAVNILCMPADSMPFYDDSILYRKKAYKALSHIMKNGNMGHNNDVSYRVEQPVVISNFITFFRRLCDFTKLTLVFPIDSPRFFVTYLVNRLS